MNMNLVTKTIQILSLFIGIFISTNTYCQTFSYYGKVISKETKEALHNVNVILKGTAIGTTTDSIGSYKIEIPNDAFSSDWSTYLIFSAVGYNLNIQEIKLSTPASLNIELEKTEIMGEIIITEKKSFFDRFKKKKHTPNLNTDNKSYEQDTTKLTYTKRLALVIGNSNYIYGGKLNNTLNDARSMKVVLERLGFEVISVEDGSAKQIKKAIADFGEKLPNYEVGFFYYAGHGIQFKGKNYLIPIDVNLKRESEIEFECVEADRVLAEMEISGAAVKIVVLDACRNNPFERSWKRSVNGQGLASIQPPLGSYVSYATSAGSTADDGDGQNGIYTAALLKHIQTPNINIEQVFKRVRSEVIEKTNGAQKPGEYNELTGKDFYFIVK